MNKKMGFINFIQFVKLFDMIIFYILNILNALQGKHMTSFFNRGNIENRLPTY